MKNRAISVFATASLFALVACGGGGSTSSSIPAASIPSPSSAPLNTTTRTLSIAFKGTIPSAAGRSTRSLSGIPVTVTYNGATVGSGTLDGNGTAKITFTQALPAGAVVIVSAGKLSASVTLASAVAATAAIVTINADGTLSVLSSGDPNGTGTPDPNSSDSESETEDESGDVTGVSNANGSALPANLPFSLTNACGVLTLTPTNPLDAFVTFSEKQHDEGDDDRTTVYSGPFTKAVSFPQVITDSRIHVLVYDANHKLLVEVKAPLSSFTTGTTSSPAPCASASPSSSPSASASAAPSSAPSESASAAPSSSPSASASAAPSGSPSASASTAPSPAPSSSP